MAEQETRCRLAVGRVVAGQPGHLTTERDEPASPSLFGDELLIEQPAARMRRPKPTFAELLHRLHEVLKGSRSAGSIS